MQLNMLLYIVMSVMIATMQSMTRYIMPLYYSKPHAVLYSKIE